MKTTLYTLLLTVLVPAPLPGAAALLLSADGNTVYDTVNNVSWLANANLSAVNRFGLPVCSGSGADTKTCVNPSGSMSYQAAAAWVNAMNAANYLGHRNWQIPTTPMADPTCSFVGPQNNSFGWGCAASAFGSLYNALGLSAPNTAVLVSGTKVGPFSNFQPALYWSQTSLPQPTGDIGCCATFSFNSGWQGSNITSNFLFVLPMIPGKIAGTPPASGAGLQVNPDGQTVYDPIANVTWLANANLPVNNNFGLPPCKAPGSPKLCVSENGAMNFDSAAQFIQNMNAADYLGQSNWELPTADPACAASYLCSVTTAPFQSLFYTQLGLTPGTPVVTAPNIAVGPFIGIRPYLYWTCGANTIQEPCQTAGPAPGFQWSFWFDNGFQGTDVLAHDMYVTAYFLGSPTSVSPALGPAGVSPAAGSGNTTFTFTFTDPDGSQDLGVVNILVNNFLDGRHACYLAYNQPSNTLYLVDDAGDGGGPFAGSAVLSAAGSIQNRQCTVNWGSSPVTRSGNNLSLTLTITFAGSFGGNKVVYMAAGNVAGSNSGWQPMGVWQVPGGTPTTTTSAGGVSPASGKGLGPSPFTFSFSDTNGYQDLGVLDILINNSIDGRHACFLAYSRSINTLYLVDDAGDAGGPFAGGAVLNAAGAIQNSQCTVSWGSNPVNGNSNNLSLSLTLQFTATFGGERVFYLAARDANGANNTDWQALGTWAVQ